MQRALDLFILTMVATVSALLGLALITVTVKALTEYTRNETALLPRIHGWMQFSETIPNMKHFYTTQEMCEVSKPRDGKTLCKPVAFVQE